jgi:Homeodomain-like domain
MTARTNRNSAGEKQQGKTPLSPAALQRRRHEALERYLAGDPIAVICREMGCAKSWLYTWKKRHQFTEPDWVQEYSRRPQSMPTKTPDRLEADIIRLHQTLSPDGWGPVRPDVIRDHLRQHGAARVPSRRTLYRILSRQAQAVHANSFRS